MSRDVLLYGMSDDEHIAELLEWAQTTPGLHEFVPDAHRLQLERWIWDHRDQLTGRVMDVGVDNPRRWIGPNYFTFGEVVPEGHENESDRTGDLCALPLCDGELDAVVLTEVLEHCADPFTAMTEVHRVLKPGGLLLVTSPFVWPWHGSRHYKDYWRFTHQGWQLLLKDFVDLKIKACQWTTEGGYGFDLMRRWECMGMRSLTTASTGYLCSARKANGGVQ